MEWPTSYGFYEKSGPPESPNAAVVTVMVRFNGKVAYVGKDQPLHPDSVLYVGVLVEMYSAGTGFFVGSIEGTGNETFGSDLEIQLSDASVSFPLYYNPNFLITEATSARNFVLAAKKWWPYATSEGFPAWDENTGQPANGGPGA
jgi:hypothetical protein